MCSSDLIRPPNPAGGGFVCMRQRQPRRVVHVNSAERELLPKKTSATGDVPKRERNDPNHDVAWRVVLGAVLFVRLKARSSRQLRASRLAFGGGCSGLGGRRGPQVRLDLRLRRSHRPLGDMGTREHGCVSALRTTHWHATTSAGESLTARTFP